MTAKKDWFKMTIAIAGVLLLLAVSSAHAATVVTDQNGLRATAILGLDLGDLFGQYNVTFIADQAGSDRVYGDPPTFDINTQTGALFLIDAVNAELNSVGGILGIGDAEDPTNSRDNSYWIGWPCFVGCDEPGDISIFSGENINFWDQGQFEASNLDALNNIYAKFAPVPVPAAVWLFGSGLIGLVAVRKRFKK
jgi:hypothetical protein